MLNSARRHTGYRADVSQTIRNFKPMANAIEAVYMVEASPSLREKQHKLLCGDNPMTETEIGWRSKSKYADQPVVWTENIRFVPSSKQCLPLSFRNYANYIIAADKTPFVVAHEFFDALPIHAFQSVPPNPNQQEDTIQTPTGSHKLNPTASKQAKTPQWRELVVSPTPPDSTHTSLSTPKSQQAANAPPEFQLTLSKTSTPHSLYLPELSARYRALKNTPDSLIEISPESHSYVADFAKRIGGSKEVPKPSPSGAALILDYGPADTIPINSLRGIKNHARISPLSEPGLVDVSADVDFTALAEAALNASEGVEVHGPVEQGLFLGLMGIKERAEMLMKGMGSEEERRGVEGAWKRLVDRGGSGMGKVYKVLAVLPEGGGRRPVGFGGDVA